MEVTRSCYDDIADRVGAIQKALKLGSLTKKESRYLGEGWAHIFKDSNGGVIPTLGWGRIGSAKPEETKEYTDQYTIPFIISVQIEDRDGDVVRSRGVQYKNFSRSPGVFFGHQSLEIPIGQARSTDGRILFWTDDIEVKSACRFDEHDSDAMLVYNKVLGGFLNSTSLAFVPIQAWRRDRHQEKGIYNSDWQKAKPHTEPDAPAGWWFEDSDATEWSVVGVGSNPGALRDIVDREKSFMTPKLQKAWKAYCAKSINESGGCFTGSDGITWCPRVEKSVKKECDCNDCKAHKPCPCSKPKDKEKATGMMTGGGTDIDHPNSTSQPLAQKKYIRHEGSAWKVYSEAGKVLGTHSSKEDAQAQLRAVEANKHKSLAKSENAPTKPGGSFIITNPKPNVTVNQAHSTVGSSQAISTVTINTGSWPRLSTQRFIDYLRSMKYKVTPVIGSGGNAAHITIVGNRNRIHDDILTAQRWVDPFMKSFPKAKALVQADMESCRGQAGEIDRTRKASDMGNRKINQGDRVLINSGTRKGKQGTIKGIQGDTVTIALSNGEGTVEVSGHNLTSLSPIKSARRVITKRDSRQVRYVSVKSSSDIRPDEEGWYVFENGEMVDGPYDTKQEADQKVNLPRKSQP